MTPELIGILAVGAIQIVIDATVIGLLLAIRRDARAHNQALRAEFRAHKQALRVEFRAHNQALRSEFRADS